MNVQVQVLKCCNQQYFCEKFANILHWLVEINAIEVDIDRTEIIRKLRVSAIEPWQLEFRTIDIDLENVNKMWPIFFKESSPYRMFSLKNCQTHRYAYFVLANRDLLFNLSKGNEWLATEKGRLPLFINETETLDVIIQAYNLIHLCIWVFHFSCHWEKGSELRHCNMSSDRHAKVV